MSKIENLENKVKCLENTLNCLKKKALVQYKEEKICLNETDFTPTDINNPTTAEVKVWADANLSQVQMNDGTHIVYYTDGTCDEPDFIWVLNNGEIILLSKQAFDINHLFLVGTAAYVPTTPLVGWTQPLNPNLGDTVSVKFIDGHVVNYTYVDNAGIKEWQVTYVYSYIENQYIASQHAEMWIDGSAIIAENIRIKSDWLDNVFIGRLAGENNTPISATQGKYNMFIGSSAGRDNTTGYANVFAGTFSGTANISGNANTFFGYQSGHHNTTGNYNVYTGVDAGMNGNASNNVISGFHAGLTVNSNNNVIIGYDAASASNMTGGNNTFIGYRTGFYNSTGYNNIFLGYLAGFANTTGNLNTFIGQSAGTTNSTGVNNVYIGSQAGYNSTSNFNTGIGDNALFSLTSGYTNTGIGSGAGYNVTTGTYNTFVGYNSGYNALQKVDAIGSTAIGNGAYTDKNYQNVYGNADITEHLFRAGNIKASTAIFSNIGTGIVTKLLGVTSDGTLSTNVVPKVYTTTDLAICTIDIVNYDIAQLTAITNATTFNVSGTPINGQNLEIWFKDAGVAKSLTWSLTNIMLGGLVLPTITIANKQHYVKFIYHSTLAKWVGVSVLVEA